MANQTCSKKPLKPYAPPFYPSTFNHHHASIANRTNKWSAHFQVATGPRNCVVPNRKPKDKPRFKSKNSLMKHFEDMRLCRPFKEYLQVWFNPPRDGSMSCLTTKGMRTIRPVCTRRFRESLRRATDGAEAFLILTLFILSLDKVSTDHAKLVPLGKVCTAKESLEKNTAKGLVVHMLIEKKYHLKKEIVMQMLKLKLESEEESTMALELIRFIKKVMRDIIDEYMEEIKHANLANQPSLDATPYIRIFFYDQCTFQ
ncbi:hypothetical protein Tco_0645904 [Tanacetum coccineum]